MSINLLSRAECEQILREENAERHLIDFQLQPATDVIGFLGEYHHLFIKYTERDNNVNLAEPTLRQPYFVKSIPFTNTESEKIKIFSKEAKLYATLLPKMQRYSRVKWSPLCYLTRDDLFVMEELRAASYRPPQNPQNDSIHEWEMLQLLRGLAAMHASSIVVEETEHFNIGQTYEDLLEEITVHPQVAWYTIGIEALLEVARQHEEFNETLIKQRVNEIYEMINTSAQYRNVFCQRDPWSGNVFFVDSGLTGCSGAIFVDFQTARYCPPSIDVIFAIYMNLSSQDRKAKEKQYLNWYYQNLIKDLQYFGLESAVIISECEFLESYEKFRLFAVVYRFLAATILKVPRELVTNDYKHMERSKDVLRYMQQNSKFAAYLKECIENVMQEIVEK